MLAIAPGWSGAKAGAPVTALVRGIPVQRHGGLGLNIKSGGAALEVGQSQFRGVGGDRAGVWIGCGHRIITGASVGIAGPGHASFARTVPAARNRKGVPTGLGAGYSLGWRGPGTKAFPSGTRSPVKCGISIAGQTMRIGVRPPW